MAIDLDPQENRIFRIVQAIREVIRGHLNSSGNVTLTANDTTTTVNAPNCSTDSKIVLFPRTANAAAKAATTYIKDTDVTRGQFVITHASSADIDQHFFWISLG